jgi:hypothetical protein
MRFVPGWAIWALLSAPQGTQLTALLRAAQILAHSLIAEPTQPLGECPNRNALDRIEIDR